MEINMLPVTLVDGTVTTATGVKGNPAGFPYPARSVAAELSWSVSSGGDKALTSLVVALEGSLTGTTYEALETATTLSATQLTAKFAMLRVVDKPCNFFRVNVTAVTATGTTGTISMTIKALPMR